jgi:hypothetical protein
VADVEGDVAACLQPLGQGDGAWLAAGDADLGLDPERRVQERVGGAPAVGKTVEFVLKHAKARILLSRPPRAQQEES